MTEHTEPEQLNDQVQAAAPTPKRRWKKFLAALCFCPILLLGTAIGMAQTERGTIWLTRIVSAVSMNTIQVNWLSGSLAKGGTASDIAIHLSSTHIDIHNLSGAWHWQYLPLNWRIANLSAQTVDITLYAQPDSGKPAPDVLMPFAFSADLLKVDTLNIIRGTNTTTITNIEGALSTDKRQHKIALTHLTQGDAQASGQVKIDGKRPFAIDTQLQTNAVQNEKSYQLSVSATGDLKHLNLTLNASGGAGEKTLSGQGALEVQLLDQYYIHKGFLDFKRFNPNVFWNNTPAADLDIHLNAQPQSLATNDKNERQPVQGDVQIINHAPAALSQFAYPITQASSDFALTNDQQSISNISIALSNNGKISGNGLWQKGEGDFALKVAGFDLKNIHPKMLTTQLAGDLSIKANKIDQHFVSTLTNNAGKPLQIFADVLVNKEQVKIIQSRISGNSSAKLELQGSLGYTKDLPFSGKAQLDKFNLADLGDFPSSRLLGQFDVDGNISPKLKLNLKGNLNDSMWADVPAKATLDLSLDAPDKITARTVDITIGSNHLDASGSLGVASFSNDTLKINVNAPNLAQLNFGFNGSLIGTADLTGSMSQPRGQVDATAKDLAFGLGESPAKIGAATIKGTWQSGAQGQMNADIDVANYSANQVKIEQIKMNVSGTQAAHQFSGTLLGNIGIKPAPEPINWQLNTQFSGQGRIEKDGWQGQISQFSNAGEPNIRLKQALNISYNAGEMTFTNLSADVSEAQLDIERLSLLGARINSRGRVNNLIIPKWLKWLNIKTPRSLSTDMTIKGQWDLTMGSAPSGGFVFERENGSIWLDKAHKQSIGLSALSLKGVLSNRSLDVTGLLESERLGRVDIAGPVGLVNSAAGWVISSMSPLNLSAKANFTQLQQFNSLLGLNLKLQGQIQADLGIKGTLNAPMYNGTLTGQNLDFLHVEHGFRLKDGVMRLKLTDTSVDFEQFEFNGVEGKVTVSGQAAFGAGGKILTAQVKMDKLKPFVRPDRQLTLSGQADLSYDGARDIMLKGDLRVDKAQIDMPPTLAPSLGNDVVVCSKDPAKELRCPQAQTAQSTTDPDKNSNNGLQTTVDLNLDLGDRFRFKGQGADVKLSGKVNLKSSPNTPVQAKGVVNVDSGTYRFYGQTLTVQRGIITFQGPMDDPALNLNATRSIGTIDVGAELTGTLANVRARLISSPEMPDEEKLSWLLFSRSSSTLSTGDGSAIASAAAVLLGTDQGRRVSEKLGIDSFNFGSSDNGLSGTVVGVGKRINDRFSVAYEQALDDVAGVVKVTWNISRSWQIVLRGGSISGGDLQYSRRFDKLR